MKQPGKSSGAENGPKDPFGSCLYRMRVVEHRNTRWGANAYRGKARRKPVVVYAVSESTLDEVQQDGDSYRTCIEREMTMHFV